MGSELGQREVLDPEGLARIAGVVAAIAEPALVRGAHEGTAHCVRQGEPGEGVGRSVGDDVVADGVECCRHGAASYRGDCAGSR